MATRHARTPVCSRHPPGASGLHASPPPPTLPAAHWLHLPGGLEVLHCAHNRSSIAPRVPDRCNHHRLRPWHNCRPDNHVSQSTDAARCPASFPMVVAHTRRCMDQQKKGRPRAMCSVAFPACHSIPEMPEMVCARGAAGHVLPPLRQRAVRDRPAGQAHVFRRPVGQPLRRALAASESAGTLAQPALRASSAAAASPAAFPTTDAARSTTGAAASSSPGRG